MPFNNDSKSIFNLYVKKIIKENTDDGPVDISDPNNAKGPKGKEFLDRVAQVKQLMRLNDPNANAEYNNLINWYRANRNDIVSQVDTTGGSVAPTTDTTPSQPTQTQQPVGNKPASPSKEDIQQQGQTGAELKMSSGGQFASRADRLNQSKVDEVLGKGKYKAGSAEANLALADYFKKNPVSSTPKANQQPQQPVASQARVQPVIQSPISQPVAPKKPQRVSPPSSLPKDKDKDEEVVA